MTGSYDDNWAALGYNSAIVRTDSGKPSSPVGFFRLRKLNCTILDRGVRGSPPTKSDFEEHSEQFQVAKNTLMKGDVIEAFKLNGLAVAEATRDYEGKDLLKSLDSVGLASTITGSGPSIAILHEDDQIDLVSDFANLLAELSLQRSFNNLLRLVSNGDDTRQQNPNYPFRESHGACVGALLQASWDPNRL